MQFCDECGSMMHTEGETWVCRSCENEEPRDSGAESTMTTQDGQRDDGAPAVADRDAAPRRGIVPGRRVSF